MHQARPFFGGLTDFMSSGPCVVLCLEAPDAIKKWRDLMGATDPAKADAGHAAQGVRRLDRQQRHARVGCARDGGVRARLLLPRHGAARTTVPVIGTGSAHEGSVRRFLATVSMRRSWRSRRPVDSEDGARARHDRAVRGSAGARRRGVVRRVVVRLRLPRRRRVQGVHQRLQHGGRPEELRPEVVRRHQGRRLHRAAELVRAGARRSSTSASRATC